MLDFSKGVEHIFSFKPRYFKTTFKTVQLFKLYVVNTDKWYKYLCFCLDRYFCCSIGDNDFGLTLTVPPDNVSIQLYCWLLVESPPFIYKALWPSFHYIFKDYWLFHNTNMIIVLYYWYCTAFKAQHYFTTYQLFLKGIKIWLS